MKTTIAVCGAAIILFAVTFRAGAEIIAGPITNPANGHDYYLLSQNSWTASEAEAEQLGGTLVVINNADEEEWVFSTFGSYGGTNRHLWIGLHRQWQGGPFAWVTDEKLDFTHWCNGEPDNGGGVESYVHMCAPNRPFGQPLLGGWNDLADTGAADGSVPYGVVEVPGKSNEKSLTEKEKSLIGAWYNNGDPDQPCWIAGTDNLLFAIDQNKDASRAVYTTEGLLFLPNGSSTRKLPKTKFYGAREIGGRENRPNIKPAKSLRITTPTPNLLPRSINPVGVAASSRAP